MHQIGHQESGVRPDRPPVVDAANFRNDLDTLFDTLQSELADLSKKRSDISRRIRLLDKTLRGLRAGVGQRSSNSLKDFGHDKGAKVDDNPSATIPTQLQRACRIALAEAAGPASPEELYARIARRESFPLGNLESAIATIVQTLGAMQEDGEVRCLTANPQGRWELTNLQMRTTL